MIARLLPLLALALMATACSSKNKSPDGSDTADQTTGDIDSTSDLAAPDLPPTDLLTPDMADLTPADALPDSATLDTHDTLDLFSPDEIESDVDYPPPPKLDVCGKPLHAWLPPSQVGGVVSFDEHPLSNMTPEDIEALVPEGYEYLLPIPYGVRNFKLRYVTQDKGTSVEATAIVGVPVGVPLDSKLPIVVFQHGTTGFMDDCAPSRDLQGGVLSSLALATRGYIAVSPDYIGMVGFGPKSPAGTIHPYLVAEPTAIACLDAVRASLNALNAANDLPKGDPQKVVLFGGSQGGHAAFFTDLYAPYYAPELALLGAVAAVPPTNLLRHAQGGCATFGEPTGSLVAALVAMRLWYESTVELTELLTNSEPYFVATELPSIMSEGCGVPNDSPYQQIDSADQIYVPDFLANCAAGTWDQTSPWGCFLAENSLRSTSVKRLSNTPFLVLFGQNDTLVYTDIERPEMQALCDDGYVLQYRECAGAGHTDVPGQAAQMTLKWIQDRIDGLPIPAEDACVIHPAQEMCGPDL